MEKIKKYIRPFVRGIRKQRDLISFFYIQRIKGFDVPEFPFFDSQKTTDFFLSELKEADIYIEYGGGGSTLWAFKLQINSITIEGDKYFLKSVARKVNAFIERMGSQPHHKNILLHRDIGITKQWSEPIFKNRKSKIKKIQEYSEFPVIEIKTIVRDQKELNVQKILVLIDGRYRVACFLKALSYLKGRTDWKILFDDYYVRDEYFVIEEFVVVKKISERMALIDSSCIKEINSNKLQNTISIYEKEYM